MRKVIALVLLALVGCGLTASPAMADGTGHSLVIKADAKQEDELYVCKDWDDGGVIQTSCPSVSRYLPKGQNTKDYLGWGDTDGIRVPNGYVAKCNVTGPDIAVYNNRTGGTRWVKMSPYSTCPSATDKVYLAKL